MYVGKQSMAPQKLLKSSIWAHKIDKQSMAITK